MDFNTASMKNALPIILVLLCAEFAGAVNPGLSTVLPRGGQRGTDVEVTFHGSNLADAVDVFFHDPGITVKEVKEAAAGTFKVVLGIAPEADLGNHRLRVRTATGISSLVFFSVGNLKEAFEAEPNSQMNQAQLIELNSTLNGTVTNEDVDYFAVELPENSRLAVEVEALRLGQELFDVKVRLFSPAGHELIAEDDTALMKQDATFVFQAEKAGKYVVALSESTYAGSGNYHYRTHIGNFPRPLAVTPMGVQVGAPIEVTWLGDPGIQKQSITLPEGPTGARAILPQNDLGVAPSAVPFRVIDYPGVLEVEPNNTNEEATAGAVPGAFDGVIQVVADSDIFSFQGTNGQVFDARVWAREMGSPLDSILTITAPSGAQVLSNDDGRGLDSYGRITLPEDGLYTLSVHDQLKRGGEAFAYRVELTPVQANMTIAQRHNEQALASVAKGNRAALYLGVARSDFGGPVQVNLEGLPPGVEATFGELADGQSDLPILLTASVDAPSVASLVTAMGTGAKGEEVITGSFFQNLPVVLGRNRVVMMDTEIRGVATATVDHIPFKVDITPPKTPAIQLASKDLDVVVTRDEGFTKPITVTVPYYTPGLNGGTLTIPEGESTGVFRIEVAGNAPVGETLLLAVASSEGHTVATQFVPIQIEAPWVTFEIEDLRLEQGTEASVAVKVNQVKEFDGEFELSIFQTPKGITIPPQVISKTTTEVVFPISIAADAPEGKHGNVGFSVDIQKDGELLRHRYSGKELTIFKPLPPAVQQKEAAPEPEPKADEPPKPERRTRFPETKP